MLILLCCVNFRVLLDPTVQVKVPILQVGLQKHYHAQRVDQPGAVTGSAIP